MRWKTLLKKNFYAFNNEQIKNNITLCHHSLMFCEINLFRYSQRILSTSAARGVPDPTNATNKSQRQDMIEIVGQVSASQAIKILQIRKYQIVEWWWLWLQKLTAKNFLSFLN